MTDAKGQVLIRLDKVSKSYNTPEIETVVIKDLSLEIKKGGFVVILGPSGCGKTTMLNMIGGLDRPTTGGIFVANEEISKKDNNFLTKFRRRHIGFVFQFYNLIATLTALENIELSLEFMGLSSPRLRQKALEYLKKVGLEGKENNFPFQLSGGEQQRVAIARAIAKEPAVILADEPTGNLDGKTGAKIVDLLKDLNQQTGLTFVIVTHNQQIADIADQVIEVKNFIFPNSMLINRK